jgi:hypothetical protein
MRSMRRYPAMCASANPTGLKVFFDAKLNFYRTNKVQIFNIKNVDVSPEGGTPWWKPW